MNRAAHRASPMPQRRTRNTTDNSGTKVEAAARYPSDTRERRESAGGASSRPVDATACANTLFAKSCTVRCVRRRQCAHDDVHIRQHREHVQPYDFPEPAFHAIAIDGGLRVLRHDDSGPGMTQKGSDVPNLEICGSDPLPLQPNCVKRAFPRQPIGARKRAAVRFLRTSTGV